MVVRPLDMLNGHYVAAMPFSVDDVLDPFWEVVIRHFTFVTMPKLMLGLHSDLTNALASIHRYFVLVRYGNETDDQGDPTGGALPISVTALVASELEYAFANHRAFYDLANGVLNLFRAEPQYSAATFPTTYRKTSQRSTEELITKFGVPDAFADFVRSRESRFFLMRSIRDRIFHDGHSPVDMVFKFEDGFGVLIGSELAVKLKELNLWNEATMRPNGIGALLPILSFIASDIWSGLADLAERMARIEGCPASLIGDLHVYFRSPLARHLARLREYQERQWLLPAEALPAPRVGRAG